MRWSPNTSSAVCVQRALLVCMGQWVRNPLTGGYGLYAPYAGVSTLDALVARSAQRPLPTMSAEMLTGPCGLCVRLDRDDVRVWGSGSVCSFDCDSPLAPSHHLLLAARHVQDPADLGVQFWQDYLLAVSVLARSVSDPVSYANMGVHSGGSERHMHAHVLSGSPHASPAQVVDSCPLCAPALEVLYADGRAEVFEVVGGLTAEMVVASREHTDCWDSLRDCAGALWRAVAASTQVWDSLWCASVVVAGHVAMRVVPVTTSLAGLENAQGVSVSRMPAGLLKDAFAASGGVFAHPR